ncbi:MAG: M14 family metallopeptidase [Alphaproteobacteria bacterium]|nr:M14 family metallopeptidase [Alphaproteobacteria bacterium]
MPKLTYLDRLPDGLLDCEAPDLLGILDGPTLIDLPGRAAEPLFISVLLHGNERTGFDAVRRILRRYRSAELPRAISLFIGNVAAAASGVRTLGHQQDYNRSWPGTDRGPSPEAAMLAELTERMARRKPFASVDIHNNSGLNPHYACVNRLEHRHLHLALLFSRTVVYFVRPLGVQSAAFSPLCPAITLECGKSGAVSGTTHAAEAIEACLHLSHFPDHPVAHQDIDLMRTFAIVKVPEGAELSFDGTPADFRFPPDIDRLNFSEVAPGETLAVLQNGSDARLDVLSAGDVHVDRATLESCFDYNGSEIRFARRVIPSMLTRDPTAVRLDCLCYLMYRIGLDGEPVDGELMAVTAPGRR